MLEFLEPGVSLILGSRFCIRVAMGPEGLVSTSGCVPVMCVLGMALAPLLTGMTLGFTSPTVDTMKGSVQWDGAPVVRLKSQSTSTKQQAASSCSRRRSRRSRSRRSRGPF